MCMSGICPFPLTTDGVKPPSFSEAEMEGSGNSLRKRRLGRIVRAVVGGAECKYKGKPVNKKTLFSLCLPLPLRVRMR